MTGKRLENVSYAVIANARKGARSKAFDIPCPVCGLERKGCAAKRKVLRTWVIAGNRITLHCVRCGLEGWVAPDGGNVENVGNTKISAADDKRKRQHNAELAARIWRESCSIAGTAGEAYFNRRGIDLAAVPDYGGLRWHPKCPWQSGTAPCVIGRFSDAVTGEPRGIWRRPINGGKPKTLGPLGGCVIRLWPDELVTSGVTIGEGVETVLAAATRVTHRGTLLQPAWAAGYSGNVTDFPVLPGIEALTLLVDNDASGTGQTAAAACAQHWLAAGREVIRLTPKTLGTDFNDIIRGESAA